MSSDPEETAGPAEVHRSLGRSFAWTLSGRVATLVGSLVSAALINRALSPAGRGVLAEIQTWAGLFAVMFGCSLETAIYHFANRDRYPVSDAVRVSLAAVASAGASVLALAALSGFVMALPDKVSSQAVSEFPYVAALLVVTVLGTHAVSLGQALARVRLTAVVLVLQSVANLAVVLPAYLAGVIDIRFALIAAVIVQGLAPAAMVAVLWGGHGFSLRGVSAGLVWRFLSAGLKQHVATIATFAYTRVNQLIVFRYCGEDETGLMAAALTLAFGVFGAFGALQLALYPRVIHFADDFAITIRSLRIGFYAGLLLVLPLMLLARPLLRAYGGAAFEEGAWMFRLLVVGAWMLSLSSLVAPYYVKAGAFGLASATAVFLGAGSVALNFALVPQFRGLGAAAATMLTMVTGFALILGVLRYLSGASPMRALWPDFTQEITVLSRAIERRRRGSAIPRG